MELLMNLISTLILFQMISTAAYSSLLDPGATGLPPRAVALPLPGLPLDLSLVLRQRRRHLIPNIINSLHHPMMLPSQTTLALLAFFHRLT